MLIFAAIAQFAAQPEQIHIAFAGKGMTVSWATDGEDASVVEYGTSESLGQKAEGDAKQYIKPMYHHHAELPALQPATQYFYRCGGDANSTKSDIFSFTTAPAAGDDGSFSASVFGDWGYGVDGHAVATRDALESIKNDVEFVWHLGDIGYADDAFLHPKGPKYEKVYNDWMNWIQNITTKTPYMVAVGNHESECHSPECLAFAEQKKALANFSAYNTRWKMPYAASGSRSNMWYSYDYGLAHFVSINTETDFPGAGEENHGDSGVIPAGHFGEDGEYLKWLEADLAKANETRHLRPWVFAGGHRPLYTSSSGGEGRLNAAVEHLFAKYHVDAYFAGHLHSYGRTLPVNDKKVDPTQTDKHVYKNPKDTAYVLVGGAGCDEMEEHGPPEGSYQERDWTKLQREILPSGEVKEKAKAAAGAAWGVYADTVFGTGVLTVFNATTMRWQYKHSENLRVADEFFIVKNDVTK